MIPDGGKVHADAWSTEQEAALLQTGERKSKTYRIALRALSMTAAQLGVGRATTPGLTDDELRQVFILTEGKASKSGPATRRGELAEMGLVRPQRQAAQAGYVGPEPTAIAKRPSDLGNGMIVWEVVPGDEYVAPEPKPAERQPNAKGLAVARDVADWQIGESNLANEILRAYLNPELVAAELDADKAAF